MSTRRITVRVKKEDLAEVIEKIKGKDEEITLTLSLPDSKEIYKYLSTSDKVLDWDIDEGDEEEVEDSKDEEDVKKLLKKLDVFSEFVYSLISGPNNLSEGITSFIEATWRICKKSPEIIFGTPLFITSVSNELSSLTSGPSIEKAVLYKVIEAYYNGYSKVDIVSSLCNNIRDKWKELSKCETLTSVSILLFRR